MSATASPSFSNATRDPSGEIAAITRRGRRIESSSGATACMRPSKRRSGAKTTMATIRDDPGASRRYSRYFHRLSEETGTPPIPRRDSRHLEEARFAAAKARPGCSCYIHLHPIRTRDTDRNGVARPDVGFGPDDCRHRLGVSRSRAHLAARPECRGLARRTWDPVSAER